MKDTEEARWMSYSELAELRRIDRPSVIRIARRHRWPKMNGNDGTVRVAVPRSFLEAKRQSSRDRPWGAPEGKPPDEGRRLGALEAKIELLTTELDQARAEVRRLRAEGTELREQRAAARAQAEAAEARFDELVSEARKAWEGRADALAKRELAEARVDDLMADVRRLGDAQVRAELLQVDVERLRAELERMKAEPTALKTGRRSWFRAWLRRNGSKNASGNGG
jgi:outer membrane murein-binding lipoprotein Lpp